MPGVPYTFGNATTSIPLTQLDANFNTTATLGNTAIGLGNVTTSVGNLTLTNVNIVSGTSNLAAGNSTAIVSGTSNVVVVSSGGNVTVATNNAERMRITTAGNVGIGATSPDAKLQVQISQSSATTTDMGANSTLNLANSGTGNGVFNALKFAANQQDMFISAFNNNTQANRRLGFFVGSVAGTATTDEQVSIYGNGNFAMNSGYGSTAVAYGCRAWVNFDGTGTPAIRASGNVSSITDNGTGAYAINFSTSMPDANYGASVSVCGMPGVSDANFIVTDQNNTARVTPTTSAFSMTAFRYQGSPIDPDYVRISVFR